MSARDAAERGLPTTRRRPGLLELVADFIELALVWLQRSCQRCSSAASAITC